MVRDQKPTIRFDALLGELLAEHHSPEIIPAALSCCPACVCRYGNVIWKQSADNEMYDNQPIQIID